MARNGPRSDRNPELSDFKDKAPNSYHAAPVLVR